MRNYDRLIRFYDSWFDDLTDPDKELSGEECWLIVKAIREAQRNETTKPIKELPISIRRALSMSTLCEQVERIIERSQNMRAKGAKGGAIKNALDKVYIDESKAKEKEMKDEEREVISKLGKLAAVPPPNILALINEYRNGNSKVLKILYKEGIDHERVQAWAEKLRKVETAAAMVNEDRDVPPVYVKMFDLIAAGNRDIARIAISLGISTEAINREIAKRQKKEE